MEIKSIEKWKKYVKNGNFRITKFDRKTGKSNKIIEKETDRDKISRSKFFIWFSF